MNEQELQNALEEMRGYIKRDVAAGFRNQEDIRDSVLEVLEDEYDADELRPHAERLTHDLIQAHLREQASWPSQTDCDRLDAAFTELEQAGIVARQNFSCCGNCGSAEIWDEMEEVGKQGISVRGYTFYHMQDTEGAVDGGSVYLGYGAVDEGEEPALEIAREIVATIQRHGLTAGWDGSWKKRIRV